MQDQKDFTQAAEKDPQELIELGRQTVAELKARNELLERLANPKITLIKSRGFYTRHVRSRKERTDKRKAQRAARRASR